MDIKTLRFALTLVLLSIAPSVAGAANIMSATEVSKLAQTGKILLVDIRQPFEWQQTGVAKHAAEISIHQPGFLEKIQAQTNGNLNHPIALICAHGNRSTWAANELEKLGYSKIINVKEGMLGSSNGTGWLAKGLPLK